MAPLITRQASSPAEDLHTSQGSNVRAFRAKRLPSWRLSTWNIRSMVDTNGPVEVASQCGRGESRKVDQIVHVLGQYDIKIAALQEIKWFGSDVYQVAGAVVLTAGRSVPSPDEPVKRGEGVALVLLGDAIASWKAAGKQ